MDTRELLPKLGLMLNLRVPCEKAVVFAKTAFSNGVPCVLVHDLETAKTIHAEDARIVVGADIAENKTSGSEENGVNFVVSSKNYEDTGCQIIEIDENDTEETVLSKCHNAVCSVFGFKFKHLGVNCQDKDEAEKSALTYGLFGMSKKTGASSSFAGTEIEFMHTMYRGKNGHIGFAVTDVPKALAYLDFYGFSPVMETAKYDQDNILKMVYLEPEIAGFAVHIMRG